MPNIAIDILEEKMNRVYNRIMQLLIGNKLQDVLSTRYMNYQLRLNEMLREDTMDNFWSAGPGSPNYDSSEDFTISGQYKNGRSIDALVEEFGLDAVSEEIPLGDMIDWAIERADRQKESAISA